MEVGGHFPRINPKKFPAKLWRLVNDPSNGAISWATCGEVIVINQLLFESQILSRSSVAAELPDSFITNNFSSIVRQLNLYGFRKVHTAHTSYSDGGQQFFYNPNFKRGHPELLVNLKRLTVNYRAKLGADLRGKRRPAGRYPLPGAEGDGPGKDNSKISGCYSLSSQAGRESADSYHEVKSQPAPAYDGLPIPSAYLMKAHSAALSPASFPQEKNPAHHYAANSSGLGNLLLQQGLPVNGNQSNPTFTPYYVTCQLEYFSPDFQYCHSNLGASHMAGNGLQTGLFPTPTYIMAGYPVSKGGHCGQSQELQSPEKLQVNLDTVFQVADELMQTAPSSCVVTSEKAERVCPHSGGPIAQAAVGNLNLHTFLKGESLDSVPEQMPGDIFEVSSDDVINVDNTSAESNAGSASHS